MKPRNPPRCRKLFPQADDIRGYLDEFGVTVRVKGTNYLGIIDDDYSQAELGRVRVATNTVEVLFDKADIRAMSLALGDSVEVPQEDDPQLTTALVVRSIQPRTDGFTLARCIEPT